MIVKCVRWLERLILPKQDAGKIPSFRHDSVIV